MTPWNLSRHYLRWWDTGDVRLWWLVWAVDYGRAGDSIPSIFG